MAERRLTPVPLTAERFAPYGDVIEAGRPDGPMNAARFERYDDLCRVDAGDSRISVSIARCRLPNSLPHRIDFVERHPLGSQAFVPLSPCRMLVVVAPPGESVDAADLAAFETNGHQGINYRPGTWHMPLFGFEAGQRYLIIERAAGAPNCDIHRLEDAVILDAR
ncbi:MAG TPA: ureidoglycolate lyase [Woeseiaceae bacterium]|nr:ureidoglycolate lyase [Woeseiaceae bacterium]